MGNLIPVTEMKNVLKAQNTRGLNVTFQFRRLQHKYENILNREIGRLTLYKNNFTDLSAILQATGSHAQLKLFRLGQSRYPGWSVHMGKFSISVTEISVAKTEISVTGPARLLI